MVKRIVWTNTAKKARRDILEYWIKHNGSNTYSKRLSRLFKIKVALLQSGHYLGKPTDFKEVRGFLQRSEKKRYLLDPPPARLRLRLLPLRPKRRCHR